MCCGKETHEEVKEGQGGLTRRQVLRAMGVGTGWVALGGLTGCTQLLTFNSDLSSRYANDTVTASSIKDKLAILRQTGKRVNRQLLKNAITHLRGAASTLARKKHELKQRRRGSHVEAMSEQDDELSTAVEELTTYANALANQLEASGLRAALDATMVEQIAEDPSTLRLTPEVTQELRQLGVEEELIVPLLNGQTYEGEAIASAVPPALETAGFTGLLRAVGPWVEEQLRAQETESTAAQEGLECIPCLSGSLLLLLGRSIMLAAAAMAIAEGIREISQGNVDQGIVQVGGGLGLLGGSSQFLIWAARLSRIGF
jgi:hypothetical protein